MVFAVSDTSNYTGQLSLTPISGGCIKVGNNQILTTTGHLLRVCHVPGTRLVRTWGIAVKESGVCPHGSVEWIGVGGWQRVTTAEVQR